MAKFKIGDRVKVDSSKYPQYYSATGTITIIWHDKFDNYSYNIDFQKSDLMANTIPEKWIELVEPQEDKPSKVVYDYRGHDDVLELIKGMMGAVIIVDQKDYCDSILRDFATSRHIDLRMYVDRSKAHIDKMVEITKHKDEQIKKAFERPMVDEELAEKLRYTVSPLFFQGFGSGKDTPYDIYNFRKIPVAKGTLELVEEIMNYGKPKNRIPDRVVFNQDKGKVTVLISKHLDGVAPYWAYTSKVHEGGGDKFDAEFGFLLSYYKYLTRQLAKDVQHEMIERLFKLPLTKRFAYLLGVVEQEVLKIEGIKNLNGWLDIYTAITNADGLEKYNYDWDYLEWKEMLRVHELETKREHQKEINKQIKAHQLEIDKLKKENEKQ